MEKICEDIESAKVLRNATREVRRTLKIMGVMSLKEDKIPE
jgi:hypothetical protein